AGRFIVGQGLVVILLAVVDPTADVVGPVEAGVVGDHRVVIREGLVVLFFSVFVVGAVVVGKGRLRVEFDGLVEIGEGLVGFVFGNQSHAAGGVGVAVLRIAGELLGEIGDGLVGEDRVAPGDPALLAARVDAEAAVLVLEDVERQVLGDAGRFRRDLLPLGGFQLHAGPREEDGFPFPRRFSGAGVERPARQYDDGQDAKR